MRWVPAICLLIFCGGLAGCASEKEHPFESVAQSISDRTSATVRYDHQHPPEVDTAIADLLSKPLSSESSIRIALLNNRNLAAEFENIGIAEADFLTAVQIQNPTFGVDARFPDKPPRGTDIEMSLMFNFVDLFMLPVRKKIAANQLDQATLRAGDSTLQLVQKTRQAFYRYVGRQQLVELQRQTTGAIVTAEEFADRQHAAGNINDLEFTRRQADVAQARLDLIHAEAELVSDRETLNVLLGLNESQINWTAVDGLPPLPKSETAPITRRLDLEMARKQIELADQSLAYARKGLLTEVNVGVMSERDPAAQTIAGPALSLEVPIFNQHQGQIARAEAELRQSKKNLDALTLRGESETRRATADVTSAREAVELATNRLLPERTKALSLTQQQYNGMLASQYTLLLAKQEELAAQREVVELLRDYWIARADLDRATGN